MAVFKYQGFSADNKVVTGVVEAYDQFDALQKARQQCRVVDKITEVHEAPNFLKTEIGSGKVKDKSLAIMCSQFSTIITAGMSISRCVNMVAEQTADKKLKPLLQQVADDVATGRSLADSFESKGRSKLPTILYETVRAGEMAGTLDHSFKTLHTYFDKTSKTKAKVAQTITYPIFVLILAIVVVAVMMLKVVPTFKNLLEGYDGQMPLMTQILIDVSDFFGAHWLVMLIVVIAAALLVKLFTKTRSGAVKWAQLKMKTPVLGNIRQLSNSAMFANTMAVLVSSGLQVTNAVEITAKVMSSSLMAEGVEGMRIKLEAGKRLSDSMREVPYMPATLTDMVAVGEETGSLEETLMTMGAFYDDETERATQKALARLEPGILIFIALFAGYIVIALYLAMFSIYGAM